MTRVIKLKELHRKQTETNGKTYFIINSMLKDKIIKISIKKKERRKN